MGREKQCSPGYSSVSEFTYNEKCVVPLAVKRAITISSVSITAIALLFALVLLFVRRKALSDKNNHVKLIVAWGVFHIPFMGLKGFIALFSDAKPATSLAMAIFVHFNGISAALLVAQLAYFFLHTVTAGTLKVQEKSTNKVVLFGVLSGFVVVLFLVGPFLYHYTSISGSVVIWGTILIADILLISSMSFFGFVLYCKIKRMINKDYDKLGRQLLVTMLLCIIVGVSTGGLCIFSIVETSYEWVIVDIVWCSNIFFAAIVLLFLTRPKERTINACVAKPSDPGNSGVSCNSASKQAKMDDQTAAH